MFCAFCGSEIPDGSVTCPVCGKNLAEPDTGKKGKDKTGKGRPGKWKLFIFIPAVVIIVAVVLLLFPYISNTFMKLTSSPEKYCQYVLKKNLTGSKMLKNMYSAQIYDRLQNWDDMGNKGELALVLSDDALDMLEDDMHIKDLEGIKNLKISYDQQKKGGKYSWSTTFSAGKKSFLTANVLYDMDEGTVYFNMPEVNAQYAQIELEDVLDEDDKKQLDAVFENGEALVKVFPAPADAQKMLDRYLKTVISGIDKVKKKEDKVRISGVEQSLTVLTIKIDEKLAKRVISSVCEEAADDKELEELAVAIIDSFLASYPGGIYGKDGADLWSDFEDNLDDILDEIDDIDFGDREYELELYVSAAGKIQGVEFSAENGDVQKEEISFVYVTKGSDIAFETGYSSNSSWSSDEFEAEGKGKIVLGNLNADIKLTGSGISDKIKIGIDKLNVAGIADGRIDGEFSLELKQFKDVLGRTPVSDLADLTVVMGVNADKKSSKFELMLKDDKDLFASVSISGKNGKAGAISMPSSSKCDIIDDTDAFADYIDDCDFEELADKMYDLDMPDELVDWVEDGGGIFKQAIDYVDKSKVAADTQLADSIHTAVLTSMMDPEIVNSSDYNAAISELMNGIDITQYTGEENSVLRGTAEILGVQDLHELRGQIKSSGATGRILVTVLSSNRVEVVIEGTDSGRGGEIIVN